MTEKTEEEKDQDFLDAYKKLCEKHKRGLTFNPSWRFSEDGSDWRMQIGIGINRLK